MIQLRHILPYFLFPVSIILMFLYWGVIKKSRPAIVASLIILLLTSNPLLSNAFLALLEQGQVRKSPREVEIADAIVVLSGMIVPVNSTNGQIYEWTDPDRFFAGLELVKHGKSDRIIFTCGKVSDLDLSKCEGEILSAHAQDFGIQADKIIITSSVLNTQQEAQAVKKIMIKNAFNKIILVTSAFHMSRAKKIFESYGIQLETYPVDSKFSMSNFGINDLLPDASSLYAFQIGIKELIGRAYYSFTIKNILNE